MERDKYKYFLEDIDKNFERLINILIKMNITSLRTNSQNKNFNITYSLNPKKIEVKPAGKIYSLTINMFKNFINGIDTGNNSYIESLLYVFDNYLTENYINLEFYELTPNLVAQLHHPRWKDLYEEILKKYYSEISDDIYLMLEIVQNPNTPDYILRELAETKSFYLRLKIAENIKIKEDLKNILADEIMILTGIQQNKYKRLFYPKITQEEQIMLFEKIENDLYLTSKEKDILIYEMIFINEKEKIICENFIKDNNNKFSLKFIDKLINSKNFNLITAIILNSNTSETLLQIIYDMYKVYNDTNIISAILQNINTPSKIIKEIYNSCNNINNAKQYEIVLKNIAENKNTPVEILNELYDFYSGENDIRNYNSEIIESIIKNTNRPLYLLEKMIKLKNLYLRLLLVKNGYYRDILQDELTILEKSENQNYEDFLSKYNNFSDYFLNKIMDDDNLEILLSIKKNNNISIALFEQNQLDFKINILINIKNNVVSNNVVSNNVLSNNPIENKNNLDIDFKLIQNSKILSNLLQEKYDFYKKFNKDGSKNKNYNKKIILTIIENKNISFELLEEIYNTYKIFNDDGSENFFYDEIIIEKIVKNKNTLQYILKEIIDSNNLFLRLVIAQNNNLLDDLKYLLTNEIIILKNTNIEKYKLFLSKYDKFSEDFIEKIIYDEDTEVIKAIAKNKYISEKILIKLINSNDFYIRLEILNNPNLTKEMKDYLKYDLIIFQQTKVNKYTDFISNYNYFPDYYIQKLANDSNISIVFSILKNKNINNQNIKEIINTIFTKNKTKGLSFTNMLKYYKGINITNFINNKIIDQRKIFFLDLQTKIKTNIVIEDLSYLFGLYYTNFKEIKNTYNCFELNHIYYKTIFNKKLFIIDAFDEDEQKEINETESVLIEELLEEDMERKYYIVKDITEEVNKELNNDNYFFSLRDTFKIPPIKC